MVKWQQFRQIRDWLGGRWRGEIDRKKGAHKALKSTVAMLLTSAEHPLQAASYSALYLRPPYALFVGEK